MPRPPPPHLVLFQRGGPQALEMFEAPLPPPPPAWNSNPNDEHFVYEGETREPSAPPSPAPAEDVEEEDEQVDAVAEKTEEEEEEESEVRTLPAWHQAHNRRRARQVIALINQDVLDAMPTDNLLWIMQAGFQSLMTRRVHH